MKYFNESKDWNLNKEFGDVLVTLVDFINKASLDGTTQQWYDGIKVLYRNVAGHKRMDKDKMKILKADLDELKNQFNILSNKNVQGKDTIEKQIRVILDDINIRIIEEMYLAELLFPMQEKKEKGTETLVTRF